MQDEEEYDYSDRVSHLDPEMLKRIRAYGKKRDEAMEIFTHGGKTLFNNDLIHPQLANYHDKFNRDRLTRKDKVAIVRLLAMARDPLCEKVMAYMETHIDQSEWGDFLGASNIPELMITRQMRAEIYHGCLNGELSISSYLSTDHFLQDSN